MVPIVVTNPSRPAAQAVASGVSMSVLTCYHGMLESHPRVLCYRPPGASSGAESRGHYRQTEVGEPLRSAAMDAHSAGQEIHPYALVANAGLWEGSRRAKPPSRMRLGSAPEFVMEHPEYMSSARDGTTWLDWEIGESPLGYDIGYMGLAYPEVREYERSAYVSFARDFGADGVQMEYVQVLAEGDEVWPLGYDEPALEAYRERYGVDPREVDADDEAWARLRAGYFTQFVRELREDLDRLGRKVELSVATEGVWADPSTAYKQMIDWPTWVDEGIIDTLHARFWIIDPEYPQSYPNSETGSWLVDDARIAQEVSAIKEVVGDRCKIYGTVICKHDAEAPPAAEVTPRIVSAAKAMLESGSDAFGIYTDGQVMATDEFWECMKMIHEGRI